CSLQRKYLPERVDIITGLRSWVPAFAGTTPTDRPWRVSEAGPLPGPISLMAGLEIASGRFSHSHVTLHSDHRRSRIARQGEWSLVSKYIIYGATHGFRSWPTTPIPTSSASPSS